MRYSNTFKITFLTIISLFIGSCEKDKVSDRIIEDPLLLSKLYSDSVDTLYLENNKFILEAYLYRDFMPSIPSSNGSPTIASISLLNCDSLPMPNDLQRNKLYVINNQLIWISTPKDRNPNKNPDYKFKMVSSNGPAWGPNISVDVILSVFDNSNDKEYFIIIKNQPIGAVW